MLPIEVHERTECPTHACLNLNLGPGCLRQLGRLTISHASVIHIGNLHLDIYGAYFETVLSNAIMLTNHDQSALELKFELI